MTATVDLFVLDTVRGAEEIPLYEPRWLFVNYADTAGLWVHDASNKLVFQVSGIGRIIDALFGDGPKRYGLTTARPVVLAEYDYGKQKVFKFATRKHSENRHLVLRTKAMERVQHLCEQDGRCGFNAISLEEFSAFVRSIPPSEMAREGGRTRPMNAFITDLDPKGRLVLPLIGTGLTYHWDALNSVCGFYGAIIEPKYLE